MLVTLSKVLEDSSHDYTGDSHFRVCARFCGAYFLIVTPSGPDGVADYHLNVGIRVPEGVDVFGECPKLDRPNVATAYRSEPDRNGKIMELTKDWPEFEISIRRDNGWVNYYANPATAIEIIEWLARELKAEVRWPAKEPKGGRQEPGSHQGHDYPVTGGLCKNGCNCRRWANGGGWRYWSPVDVDPGGACPLRPGQMPAHAYRHTAEWLADLRLRYGGGRATPVNTAETVKLVETIRELCELLTEGPRLTDPWQMKEFFETKRQYQRLRAAVIEDLRERQRQAPGTACFCPYILGTLSLPVHTDECKRALALWELVK